MSIQSAVTMLKTFLVYYMAQEYVGRVGRKRDIFRMEPDYQSIMADSNSWRDTILVTFISHEC